MDTMTVLTRLELIQRTNKLMTALMLGYELTCSNGMVLRIDEEGSPWIKGEIMKNKEYLDDTFIKALFNVDIKFLQSQAEWLSEEKFIEISTFITTNSNKEL